MFRELVVAGHGGDRKSENIKSNNITLDSDLFTEPESESDKPKRGTGRAYTLARLKRERPDLFEKVAAKEMSANAAAIAAGWRKQSTPVDRIKADWPRLTAEERAELLAWIAREYP